MNSAWILVVVAAAAACLLGADAAERRSGSRRRSSRASSKRSTVSTASRSTISGGSSQYNGTRVLLVHYLNRQKAYEETRCVVKFSPQMTQWFQVIEYCARKIKPQVEDLEAWNAFAVDKYGAVVDLQARMSNIGLIFKPDTPHEFCIVEWRPLTVSVERVRIRRPKLETIFVRHEVTTIPYEIWRSSFPDSRLRPHNIRTTVIGRKGVAAAVEVPSDRPFLTIGLDEPITLHMEEITEECIITQEDLCVDLDNIMEMPCCGQRMAMIAWVLSTNNTRCPFCRRPSRCYDCGQEIEENASIKRFMCGHTYHSHAGQRYMHCKCGSALVDVSFQSGDDSFTRNFRLSRKQKRTPMELWKEAFPDAAKLPHMIAVLSSGTTTGLSLSPDKDVVREVNRYGDPVRIDIIYESTWRKKDLAIRTKSTARRDLIYAPVNLPVFFLSQDGAYVVSSCSMTKPDWVPNLAKKVTNKWRQMLKSCLTQAKANQAAAAAAAAGQGDAAAGERVEIDAASPWWRVFEVRDNRLARLVDLDEKFDDVFNRVKYRIIQWRNEKMQVEFVRAKQPELEPVEIGHAETMTPYRIWRTQFPESALLATDLSAELRSGPLDRPYTEVIAADAIFAATAHTVNAEYPLRLVILELPRSCPLSLKPMYMDVDNIKTFACCNEKVLMSAWLERKPAVCPYCEQAERCDFEDCKSPRKGELRKFACGHSAHVAHGEKTFGGKEMPARCPVKACQHFYLEVQLGPDSQLTRSVRLSKNDSLTLAELWRQLYSRWALPSKLWAIVRVHVPGGAAGGTRYIIGRDDDVVEQTRFQPDPVRIILSPEGKEKNDETRYATTVSVTRRRRDSTRSSTSSTRRRTVKRHHGQVSVSYDDAPETVMTIPLDAFIPEIVAELAALRDRAYVQAFVRENRATKVGASAVLTALRPVERVGEIVQLNSKSQLYFKSYDNSINVEINVHGASIYKTIFYNRTDTVIQLLELCSPYVTALRGGHGSGMVTEFYSTVPSRVRVASPEFMELSTLNQNPDGLSLVMNVKSQ